jgi:hypothetical protein
MKDTMMFVFGAAAGVGMYMGMEALSKNKNNVKKTMNDIIDDTSKLVSK